MKIKNKKQIDLAILLVDLGASIQEASEKTGVRPRTIVWAVNGRNSGLAALASLQNREAKLAASEEAAARKSQARAERALCKLARQAAIAASLEAKKVFRKIRHATRDERARNYRREYSKRLRTTNRGRVLNNLGRRTSFVLKRRRIEAAKSKRLFGCEWVVLESRISSLFRDGMTWENYGTVWHLDHIKPVSTFTDTEIAEGAHNHYLNLQPLLAEENMKKGAKWQLALDSRRPATDDRLNREVGKKRIRESS